MESHLYDERLWKVIQEVIEKQISSQSRAAAAEIIASSASSPEIAFTPGSTDESSGPLNTNHRASKSNDEPINDQLK